MKVISEFNFTNNLLTLLLIVPFAGLAIPYGFPLFPILAAAYIIFSFSKGERWSRFRDGFKTLKLVAIVLSALFLSMLVNYDSGDYILKKDILALSSLALCFICFSMGFVKFGTSQAVNAKFTNIFTHLVFVVCVVSLIKMLLITKSIYLVDPSIKGTSLTRDYNMYSLAIIIALLAVIYSTMNIWMKTIYTLTFSACILLSSSRRGALVLICIYLILYIYIIYHSLGRLRCKSISTLASRVVLTTFSVILPIFIAFYFVTQYQLPEHLQNQNIDKRLIKQVEQVEKPISHQTQMIADRFKTILSTGNTGVIYQRMIRFNQSLTLLEDYEDVDYIFGKGYDYHHSFQIFNNTSGLDYPHNILLSTLLSQGIVGFVLLVALFSTVTFYSLKLYKDRNYRWILFSNLILITFMLTSGDTLASQKYYVIFSMFVIFLYKELKNEKLTHHFSSI